ncbi:MAG: porin [Rikenellaceae bacterium]
MKKIYTVLCVLFVFNTSICAQDLVTTDVSDANVYFQDGKLTFKSRDDKFKLWFDNRVYIDGAVYSPIQDISGLNADPNDDIALNGYSGAEDDGQFKFSNGVVVRRARFGVKATLYDKWFAELDVDFAYNEIEMKDMFLGYKFNEHFSIKAGNFKEPLSMERLTSSKYLTGMERPMAVQTFAGGRKIGVAATGWGEHWWASAGVFGGEASILQKEKNRGSDGWSVSGRVAYSPIVSRDFVLHLGAYASYRTPEAWGSDDQRWVYFAAFPETRVDGRRFVRAKVGKDGDGGYVDSYVVAGGELAVKYKKFLGYGEYIHTQINRHALVANQRVELNDAKMGGWYATASYMILGEQRYYDKSDAEFGPMNVRKRGGNLEIMGRVSTIDMNDASDSRALIMGGSAVNYTAALNWYPVRNILISMNYIFVDNDKYADDKGDLTAANGVPLYMSPDWQNGIDFNVFQMRLLVSF